MVTKQATAEISAEKLLEAVNQLSLPELEKFVAEVIALKAHRRTPGLTQTERELLQKINQPVIPEVRARYHALMDKRRALTISDNEYKELLELTNHVENMDAKRVEALGELAQIRHITLDALMESLGIQPRYS